MEDPKATQTRMDVDRLMARLVAVMAAPDGVESGFMTSEFWLAAIAVAVDVAGPRLGLTGQISGSEQMLIAAGIVAVYGGLRTWRKQHAAQLQKIAQRIAERLGVA